MRAMHATITNSAVKRMARTDAPASATAKAPDAGRFRELLQADVAVEVPVEAAPAVPAMASVGKIPVAMMRPPDVSSSDDAVAKTAIGTHEAQHSKTSQDTGAVSVAKEVAKKDEDETSTEPQTITPEPASPIAALQPLPMPLPVVSVAVPAEDTKPAPADAKLTIGAAKNLSKKNASAPANIATVGLSASIVVAPAQAAVAEMKQNTQSVSGAITPAHIHVVGTTTAQSKSAVVLETAPKATAPSDPQDMKTLVATPNTLEVGIATGTHGWLRVRAELGQMGEVTASLAAATASATDGLHKELPAISAYLSSERVAVSSLVVNSTESGTGMESASEQKGNRDRRQANQPDQTKVADNDSGMDFNVMGIKLPAAVYANGSGSWLSVRV